MAKTGIESGNFCMNIVSYAFPVAMLYFVYIWAWYEILKIKRVDKLLVLKFNKTIDNVILWADFTVYFVPLFRPKQ